MVGQLSPACASAASTAFRPSSLHGAIGNLVSLVTHSCSVASAYLVGDGLASANRALWSGNRRSLSALARAKSPAAAAAWNSAHSFGATLAVTEMQPTWPSG